ncbi:TlpA family protein disulfide reductase [Orenia marismortui]|uniref:TlpA family protein disulfide reductase n=1 Tax=Orenia marismortui TaxID=46469 RepID=UPI00035F3AE5|nr:TlpA disulfide reductase family protein [Orenia marismortui]
MKKLIIIMITFILIISFFIGGIISIIFKFKEEAHSKEKVHLPKITLTDLENNKISFNKLAQPTILLFFLPQSKSCQEELDILKKFKNQYPKLNILAIAIGNIDPKKIQELINQSEINYPIIIDKKVKLTEKLSVTAIPTLVFYNPYDKPFITVGLKEETELEKLLKEHLTSLSL